MGVDHKYGRVTVERGTIGEDEPVVVFRAQDRALPDLLHDYALRCQALGVHPDHLLVVEEARQKVVAWQQENPTKVPDTDPWVSP